MDNPSLVNFVPKLDSLFRDLFEHFGPYFIILVSIVSKQNLVLQL